MDSDMFPEIVSGKKEEDISIRRLVFDKNWNNKLLCFNFINIVPASDEFEIGEKLDIRIKDRFLCYATISYIKTFKLSEIILFRYNIIDCGLEQKEFLELMATRYDKRKFWKGQDTEMQVMFFSKVEQLNINL